MRFSFSFIPAPWLGSQLCTALVSLQRLVEKLGSLASTRVEHFRDEDMSPLIRPDQRFNPTASQQKFLFVNATAKRFFLLKQVPRLKFRHSGLLPEKKNRINVSLVQMAKTNQGEKFHSGSFMQTINQPQMATPGPYVNKSRKKSHCSNERGANANLHVRP